MRLPLWGRKEVYIRTIQPADFGLGSRPFEKIVVPCFGPAKFLLDGADNVSLGDCENATNVKKEEQGIAPLGDNSKTLKWTLSYRTKPEKGRANSYTESFTKERL